MTPQDRFEVLVALWGVACAITGWVARRRIAINDAFRQRVDALILSDTADQAVRPMWAARMDRLEAALVTLSATVTELGLAQSRHEGWHESHNPAEAPRMGARRGD